MSNRMNDKADKVPQGSNNDFFKLDDGDNHFRVLSEPIVGYETRVEEDGKKKPLRSKTRLTEEPKNISVGKFGTQFNRYFRAFIVWDYSDNSIKFLQLDKRGILADIENYLSDEDKNDPRTYDMIVTKSGTGKDTSYSLRVKDNKELSEEIKNEREGIKDNIDMEGHFEGKYVLKEAKEASESSIPF